MRIELAALFSSMSLLPNGILSLTSNTDSCEVPHRKKIKKFCNAARSNFANNLDSEVYNIFTRLYKRNKELLLLHRKQRKSSH